MTAARPARRPRRGATLIEVVIIVGCVGVILGLCGGFLHVLLALDRSGRAALSDGTTVARLGRQFRQDVRAADGAKVISDGAGLELTTPGGPSVTYRHQAGKLL